jgi:hypothetical protein
MSKENTATVYGLDKGAYLINKQPQLINDRHLKEELQRSEMYFKNTKEYIICEQADVLFWTEIKAIEQLKFNVKHYAEILRYIIDENGNKHYFVIHPELLNSTLGQYVLHLENKLKEQGIAPMFIQYK